MATIQTLPLGEVLSVLRPTYTALDVRLVIARTEDRWTLAAGIIAATYGTVSAVRRQHSKIAKNRPLPSKRLPFKILLEALPATSLRNLLDGLDKAEFKVGGELVHVQTDQHDTDTKVRQRVIVGSHHSLSEADYEQWRFPRYGRSIRGAMSAEEVLAKAGGLPSDLHLPNWNHLNAWLGFDLFDVNGRSATNLELSFPIYAMLDEIPVLDGSTIEVHGRAHGRLQSSVVAHWDVSRSNTILETADLKIPRPKNRGAMNTFIVSTRVPQQFSRGDHVAFQLYHRKLGALGREVTQSYNFLHGVGSADPLRRVVELFDGGKNFRAYLRNERPEKKPTTIGPFESGVLWLLELMGVRAIPLLLVREAENIRSGKELRGSADLVAHHPNLGMMLFDCTRAVPDAQKADQLLESTRFLTDKLRFPIRCAIVVPADVVASRQDRAEQGVAVVDGQDLQELYTLVVNGNPDAALSYLQVLLDRVPRIDAV